jgi:hypothetical protein
VTHRPEHDPRDQAVEHWLRHHQRTLTDALDDVLDTEAGLREALLQSRHDTAADGLDTVLNVEAGLDAILPTPREPTPTSHPATHETTQDHTTTEELLQSLSPSDRMILRNHPDVAAASRALDLDLDRELDHVRVGDLDLDRDLVRDRDRYLARDRALVGDLDLARALARALDLVRDLDRALVGTIIDIRTNQVRRAIGLVLRREPPALDRNSVHAYLDDFTTADLRTAELTGVSLVGVRWSEYGTQWPPSVDVGVLKAHSEETPPGSGTWVVRSGTATVRGLTGM